MSRMEDWERYKHDRLKMLKRHEEEQRELVRRQRAESEAMIEAFIAAQNAAPTS